MSLVGSNYGGFGTFQVSWTNPCNTQSESGLINGTCNGLFISDLNTLYIYFSGTSTTIPSTSRTVNLSPPLSTYVMPSIPVTISTPSFYISTSNNKGFGPNSDFATCTLSTPAAPPYANRICVRVMRVKGTLIVVVLCFDSFDCVCEVAALVRIFVRNS